VIFLSIPASMSKAISDLMLFIESTRGRAASRMAGMEIPSFFLPENDGNQWEKYDVQIVLSIGGPIIFRLTHISEMFMGYL
jgi:hypothetical protein